MADNHFDKYLEHRFQQAGALTPGQKLEVLETLRSEAHNGRFPFGNSVASLPVDNPAVQAVLRGEAVSLGAATVKSGTPTGGLAGRLGSLPTAARIGLLAAIFFVPLLLVGLLSGLGKKAAPTATPTLALSATATFAPTQPPPPTPLPPPTALPPTPTPTFLLGSGKPADDNRDPASIEIAGRLFILSKGQVGKEGAWRPNGPEWLAGTEVRRVFAVPYTQLQDVTVQANDEILVRTRGGQVLTYFVRDVVKLLANQIEVFNSLRPSLVVALPMQAGDVSAVERQLIFGEVKAEASAQTTTAENLPSAYVRVPTNLRRNPGLQAAVLTALAPGTAVFYQSSAPAVQLDGYTWLYVYSPAGYGWVAEEMLESRE
jgi:hypothetical protein